MVSSKVRQKLTGYRLLALSAYMHPFLSFFFGFILFWLLKICQARPHSIPHSKWQWEDILILHVKSNCEKFCHIMY